MDSSGSDLTFNDIFEVIYKNNLDKQKWVVGRYNEFNNIYLKYLDNFKCNSCDKNLHYLSNNLLLPNVICINCKTIKFRCISCDNYCIVKKNETYFKSFSCSSCEKELINIYNQQEQFLDEDTKNEICKDIFTSYYSDNTI